MATLWHGSRVVISSELVLGRSLLVVVEPGEPLMATVLDACADHGIVQGYLPVFLGAFTTLRLIGTCGPPLDRDAPIADEVWLDNVEGSGSGTLCVDPGQGKTVLHLHAALGVKQYAANGYAGHVLEATVQYVAEIVVQEVVQPLLTRRVHPGSSGLPILHF
jgi:predicted DNA-binding protein with PD1-like motif